jgi:hypothetical protein
LRSFAALQAPTLPCPLAPPAAATPA